MKNIFCAFLIVSLLTILSCSVPNYNYSVEAPTGWRMYDTSMQGLQVRFLIPTERLTQANPIVNIIIKSMENRNIDVFTGRNMTYLKQNMESVVLQERGNITTPAGTGRWFTYTKVNNGVKREMINYIIPLNGFAYMITCGTNDGHMINYRSTFDAIVASFRG